MLATTIFNVASQTYLTTTLMSLFSIKSYLFSRNNNEFSELDLQKFENQAENIIKRCSEAIRTFKSKTTSHRSSFSVQYNQHLENMFYLMDKYLKDVLKMYADQKAVRVQRAKEKQT